MNDHVINGVNVLTVFISKPSEEEKYKRNAFFCPYTTQITSTYQGKVMAILPGYDPEDTPQVLIYPQRMQYGMNINYTFKESTKGGDRVNFWIQDQYFNEEPIKTYFCQKCQAPSLYFSDNKVVHFNTKADIKPRENFECVNPYCKTKYTYLGMVRIDNIV